MPYIVKRQHPAPIQISVDDILNNLFDDTVRTRHITKGGTLTRFVKVLPEELERAANVEHIIALLNDFNHRHENLFAVENRKSLYREFYIPKNSGGMRKIDAPCDELQLALYELKLILKNDVGLLHHTANYAYTADRSTVDCVKRHQANGSRWKLKIDFSNFFGSTTLEFVMRMFEMIYPLSEVMKVPEGKAALEKALSLGWLDGGLPQGTKLSPDLTCWFMVPIDHYLANYFGKKQMVYTRYADDIYITSKYDFKWRDELSFIQDILKKFGAPFSIKPEKTEYHSMSGKNYMLGVILTEDGKISIGSKKKKTLKAMLNNYINDSKKGLRWELGELHYFGGQLSYMKMVEPDYFKYVINWYNKKYNVDFKKMFRADIGGRHMSR